MTDLDEKLIAHQRELLSAARGYKASASTREATLAKLGLASPTATSAPDAAADAGSIPMNSTPVHGIVAVAGAGLLVVASIAMAGRDRPQPLEAPPPPVASGPTDAFPVAPPSATIVVSVSSASSAPVSSSPASTASSKSSGAAEAGTMTDEIAMLDAISAHVRAGEHAGALSAIQRYRKRFPQGRFAPEALALEVEALHKSGKVDQARALARRFIASSPDSPLANRIRKLVGIQDESPGDQ